MTNQLTIIMYHYVRDVEKTKFPGIKARSVNQFINQLKYLKNNYNVIPTDLNKCAFDIFCTTN